MKRVTVVLLCIFAISAVARSAGRKVAPSKANEPFHTFDLLDKRLARINSDQDELRRVIHPAAAKATSTKPGSHPWTKPARDAEKTANSFKLLAKRQQSRYRSMKQSLGVRAFGAVTKRAAAVEQSAALLVRTKDDALAKKHFAKFEQDSLSLVLQYQALTGGYGAMHCSAGQRPCCEEKPSQPGSEKVLACKWGCVASVAACGKGFTGSRIPTR